MTVLKNLSATSLEYRRKISGFVHLIFFWFSSFPDGYLKGEDDRLKSHMFKEKVKDALIEATKSAYAGMTEADLGCELVIAI